MPEVSAKGRGSRKLLSERDLVRLGVTHVLTQRWVSLETIRSLIHSGDEADTNWFDLRSRQDLDADVPLEQQPPIEELLIGVEGRRWRYWSSGSLTTVMADGQIGHRGLTDWWRVWHLVQGRTDAIVVNVGLIKRNILAAV